MAIIDFSLNNINGSVQDDLWCTAISDNSGQTDFKYVFDIFNGDKQLIRVKVYPNPNGWGYFNCGSVVRNEMTYDWFDPESHYGTCPVYLDNPNASGQISINYQVRIGEDVSGVTTLNMASGESTAYNITSPLFKRNRPYYNPLELNSTNSKNWKFLTNRPKNAYCRRYDKLLVPFYSTALTMYALYISSDGNNFDSASNYAPTGNRFQQFDIGPEAIQIAIDNVGSYDITDKDYEVTFYNPFGSEYSETFKVFAQCTNPALPTVNLYFMNQYGMFDTASFKCQNKLTFDVERKGFEKSGNTYGEYSVFTNDPNKTKLTTYPLGTYQLPYNYNETKINFSQKINHSYKLTMDFPSDEEYIWLAELITSPQVYAQFDDMYYPVVIKNTNYEYSKHQYAGLRPLEIDIDLCQPRFGFRR